MTEFRRQVGEYVNQVYYAERTFLLTKGEKSVAAVVPMSLLERLAELEEFYAQTLLEQSRPLRRTGGFDRPTDTTLSDELTISA